MNRRFRIILGFCCAFLLFSTASRAGFKPNVMILLDSSGSMGDSVQALADYVRTTTYGTCAPGNYATAKVYKYDNGIYTEYAASIVAVSSAPVQDALTTRGFWFGNLGTSSLKLFHGNYLNYEFCSSLTSRTKLAIAKSVINTIIGAIPDKRFGAMKFNSSSNGGTVVATIGTATTTIASSINGISASGTTPIGPQLRDAGLYFDGSFGYASPIQGACQQNSVFIISDGAENVGPPWVIPQAASEYARDHSTAYAGVQNLITNTVSFYLNPANSTDKVAISSLTAAAAAGGGSYVSANDPAQLSQAFFQIPPGIALNSPLPNSTVSGNMLFSVGVGNAACITSVQFQVDGVNVGAPLTAAPYEYTWNSNTVLNGAHTVTAVMVDSDGNINTSFPSAITTNNDQTPPIISNVLWNVSYTSATVTWQTNEAADTQVEYGTTTAYGTLTTLDAAPVTTHQQSVKGLAAGTAFHSKVRSRDAAGNLTAQGDYIFNTDGIPLKSPLPNSTVSGNVLLSVETNSAWVSVQFRVDGVNKGAPVASPPFNYTWDSTGVSNGAHIITAAVLDADGNTNISLPVSVTTNNDQTPPAISGVGWTVWYTSAAVTWQTDEPGDTQVEYGPTTAYGSQTTLNASLVAAHTQAVRGLPAGTTYHSKVKSRDAAGNLAAQSDYVFTTNGIPLAAPAANAVVSGNVLLSVGTNSEWASVQFKVDGVDVGAPVASAPFNYTWDSTGVGNGGHTITAAVKDKDGNTNLSLAVSVTTNNDKTPPAISGVAWTVWYTSAAVTWQTDEPGDTQAEYGLTSAYGSQTALDASLVTAHTQAVRGLPAGTTYHSKVKSRDAAGNLAAQSDYIFTTDGIPLTAPAANATVSGDVVLSIADNSEWASVQFMVDGSPVGAPVTSPPFSSTWNSVGAGNGGHTITADVTDKDGHTNTSLPVSVTANNTAAVISGVAWTVWYTSAAVTWQTTGHPSDTQVEYGPTAAYGTWTTTDPALVETHTMAIRNLPTGTLYHSMMISTDAFNITATQGDYLFATNSIPLTAPLQNSTVFGNVVLSVAANSEWASVQFKVDGVNKGAPVASPPFSYSWDSTGAANGGHTITAAVTDKDGYTNITLPVSVTTDNDQTPPAISGVGWTVWYTSAAVTWHTNEASDTQVEYGPTTAYGSQTALNASPVTTHTQAVRGLSAGAAYHSKVKSKDAAGNLAAQGDYAFTTNGIPLTAPAANAAVLGNVVLSVAANSEWASVQFKVDGNNRGAPVTSPPFNYTWDSNDVANGGHTITAEVTDKDGNKNASLPVSVTVNNDRTPPVISNVGWTIWYTSAAVSWQTDEPGDTQMNYGTTTAYGYQYYNDSLGTSHSVLLTGLYPATEYHSTLRSRDAALNTAVYGDNMFITGRYPARPGELDHLKLSFGNAQLPGPGVKSGNHPYALTAGSCYGLTIEAMADDDTHYPLDASIELGQYSLDDSGAEISLVQGISLNNLYQLGLSTIAVTMKGGYAYLGSETDPSEKVCFYRASRAAGTYPLTGGGDLRLKAIQVSSPTLSGISAGFVGWPGYARSVFMLAPDQALAPATPTGVTGIKAGQWQGTPFFVQAYLVDSFFNNTYSNTDTLRFTSSLSAQTGFFPFEGRVANGLLVSSVTVDACAASPVLSVQDLTSPSVANGQVTINMGACGAGPAGPGFYQVAVPGLVRAGDPFAVTITVKNVNIPVGYGSVRYAGNLVPLVPLDLTHFTYASGALKLPAFEFSIPDGYDSSVSGDYVYVLNNQAYNRSEFIWVQLAGTAPPELKNATALGGPMQVLPGNPARLTASASPDTIGPLSSTVINAKLMDRYGNGVPNTTVSAEITQGTGNFNKDDIPSTSLTLQTDANGEISIPFVSHRVSETDKVRIWVPSYPDIYKVVTISITLLGDKVVAVYPNPVPITKRPATIEYRLDVDSVVELLVTDAFGHEIWRRKFPAGSPGGLAGYNTVEWDGRNGSGERVAVGVYGLHLRMTANSLNRETKTRFALVK